MHALWLYLFSGSSPEKRKENNHKRFFQSIIEEFPNTKCNTERCTTNIDETYSIIWEMCRDNVHMNAILTDKPSSEVRLLHDYEGDAYGGQDVCCNSEARYRHMRSYTDVTRISKYRVSERTLNIIYRHFVQTSNDLKKL
jgi:hypothetical protein